MKHEVDELDRTESSPYYTWRLARAMGKCYTLDNIYICRQNVKSFFFFVFVNILQFLSGTFQCKCEPIYLPMHCHKNLWFFLHSS